MRIFFLFFYLVLIIVSLAFAALNSNEVVLNLYWQTLQLPLAFVMIVCIGLGLLLGALVFLVRYWHLRCQYSKTKNLVSLLEKEIKNLRSIPIQDSH
jgi:lipopolysaccharide assembly protein A